MIDAGTWAWSPCTAKCGSEKFPRLAAAPVKEKTSDGDSRIYRDWQFSTVERNGVHAFGAAISQRRQKGSAIDGLCRWFHLGAAASTSRVTMFLTEILERNPPR